ncbi:phosphodiester glycosidase family protein [Rhodococcus sp. NPDC059234]|uniref:phosphodiester glycosidase family protein n=1 Tax=Rhodococcus sp. NPDC059234 TaxID=3346781 RepID=UPI00366A7182
MRISATAARITRRIVTTTAATALCAGVLAPVFAAPAQADDFAGAQARLNAAVAASGGAPLAYQFGRDFPVPMITAAGQAYDMPTDARLVVIGRASHSGLVSQLLSDSSGRCEGNPNAVTSDGMRQNAEVYAPVDAWHRMGSPAIAINANFFDVRAQGAGTNWSQSGCSSPLGAYYDAHPDTHSAASIFDLGRRFYVGKEGLSDGAGKVWSPLSTFVIGDGFLGMPTDANFDIRDADSATRNNAAEDLVNQLEYSGRSFVAFGGLKIRGPGPDFQFVDNPIRRAARTAVGFNTSRDELYVFQGGSNEADGFTIGNVQDAFRALGSDRAVVLDGGGSSALIVNKDAGITWAGQGINAGIAPAGSCAQVPGAYCSPGAERPVPGWLGLRTRR